MSYYEEENLKETPEVEEEVTEAGSEETSVSESEELKNQLLRLQADFANFKKRSERDKEQLKYMALEGFISKLLPVIDNFERALDSCKEKDDSLYEGVQMIYSQIISVLEASSVVRIDPKGEKFDPNYHNAVSVDTTSEEESGTVTDVMQIGYMLKDKVIRPAAVRVAE